MDSLSKQRRHVSRAGIFVGLLAFLFLPSFAGAVTVGPTRLQIAVDPGQSATGFLFLKNDENKKQTFYPSVQRFSVDADGQKVFTDDAVSIAKWMQLPKSVTLEAQGEKQVPFTMITPLDAAPGGHFGVIWWSTSPPGNAGQISIVTRAGILVYVRVSGNIIEKGHINSFSGDPRFAWSLPINFAVDFVNEGNVALTPKGEIRITNMFGALKATIPVNPYGGIVLPGSNGSFAALWQGSGFFFGVYKAAISLDYGEDTQNIQSAQQSWWFLVVSPLAAAIVLLVIVLVFIAPPLIRKYNRWIIDRARQ